MQGGSPTDIPVLAIYLLIILFPIILSLPFVSAFMILPS